MTITILGKPFPKQSARHTKKGFVYQTKEVKQAEDNVRWQIINQLPKNFIPFTKGVKVLRLLYVFPPLKSFTKKKMKALEKGHLLYKTTKPDLTDNLNKGLFDAMEGIIFNNDSQVCEINHAIKCYGLKPRTEIVLEEVV